MYYSLEESFSCFRDLDESIIIFKRSRRELSDGASSPPEIHPSERSLVLQSCRCNVLIRIVDSVAKAIPRLKLCFSLKFGSSFIFNGTWSFLSLVLLERDQTMNVKTILMFSCLKNNCGHSRQTSKCSKMLSTKVSIALDTPAGAIS